MASAFVSHVKLMRVFKHRSRANHNSADFNLMALPGTHVGLGGLRQSRWQSSLPDSALEEVAGALARLPF